MSKEEKSENNVDSGEIKKVKNLNYGQPARKIAEDGNPVELGEEQGSYVDQSNKKKAKEKLPHNPIHPMDWKH